MDIRDRGKSLRTTDRGEEGMGERISRFFSAFATWLAHGMGSHWALLAAGVLVAMGLITVGVENTNIAISIATLLMVFVLQNTQNRDSAALHLKLDEIITHLHGPRDELAGIETKSHDEIEELRPSDHPANV